MHALLQLVIILSPTFLTFQLNAFALIKKIILFQITVSLKNENLHLIIAAVTFYKRITQHIHYCKFSEIEDLIDTMV